MAPSIRAVGGESRVNTFTNNDQGDPNLDANPATGGYQIVWESDGQDGFGLGVYGQNFDSSGQPVGDEFLISDVTVGDQGNPDVAFNEDGNGAWVWDTNAIWNTGADTGFDAIPINYLIAENSRTRSKTFGFEADEPGSEIWNDERVRYGRTFSEDDNNAFDARVISLGGNAFAAAMQRTQRGSDVVVDEFIPAGNYIPTNPRDGNWSRNFTEDEITPRSETTSNDIMQLDDRTLIVVSTMTSNADTGAQGIIQFQPFIRRPGALISLDPQDGGQGDAFGLGDRYELEGSGTTGPAAFPRIAKLEDGGFVITWSEYNFTGDTPHFDVYFQVFNRNLSPRTEATLAHDVDSGEQVNSRVTALDDGGFVIAYTDASGADGDGVGIIMNRYNEAGQRLGGPTVVNDTTEGRQADVNLTTLNNGNVVATWESSEGDNSGKSVMQQIFDMVGYGNAKPQDIVGTSANERISTGAKADSVDGAGGKDRIDGGGGGDILNGGSGGDNVIGGGGKDRMDGGEGNDKMSGGNGNDRMTGGDGNDRMAGGKGNDRISGQDGNDILTGNGGRDTFVFDGGRDTIKDFVDNIDTVVFDNSLIAGRLTANKLARLVTETNDSLIFRFDSGRLEIQGINDFGDLRNDLEIG